MVNFCDEAAYDTGVNAEKISPVKRSERIIIKINLELFNKTSIF